MTGERPPAGAALEVLADYDDDAWRNGQRFTVAGVAPRRTAWTAAELMAETFPAPRWAVPDLIPEGLTLLCGAPKMGKSWLCLAVAVAVAAGGRALGRVEVDAGDALYLALEDTPRRLQTRLGKLLAGQSAPGRLHLELACPTFRAGGQDRLARWLDQHPGARLVVVDVLARMRDPVAPGQAYEADYAAVAGLKALADEHRVALVAVHHTRKAGAEDFLAAASGTFGLAGAADAVAVLSRSRGAADGVLQVTGRDVPEVEKALRFSPDLGLWELLDGPAVDYTVGATRSAVLRWLRASGPARPKDIAEALDENPSTMRATLKRMTDDRQLERDGAGWYRVAGEELDEGLGEVDHVDDLDAGQLLDLDAYDAPDYGRFAQ